MSPNPPTRRALPTWVEPLCVLLFCFTALVEYNRGELFWALVFVVAALGFSLSAYFGRTRIK